jgi:ABC-type antimicrobial peptide transport system permease subunit
MKQSSFTLLCCLFLASFTSFAQNTTTDEDDIYFNSADAAQAKLKQKKNKNSSANQNASNSVYYSNSSYNDQNNSYQYQNYDDEAYVDYDDNDDYYYASNLRRFNNPFYSQSYYSFLLTDALLMRARCKNSFATWIFILIIFNFLSFSPFLFATLLLYGNLFLL